MNLRSSSSKRGLQTPLTTKAKVEKSGLALFAYPPILHFSGCLVWEGTNDNPLKALRFGMGWFWRRLLGIKQEIIPRAAFQPSPLISLLVSLFFHSLACIWKWHQHLLRQNKWRHLNNFGIFSSNHALSGLPCHSTSLVSTPFPKLYILCIFTLKPSKSLRGMTGSASHDLQGSL